jgi:hypothetical protein
MATKKRGRRRKPGRPKGSKNKLTYHTGEYYTGMVGPKRPRGRPKGSRASTSGLRKVSSIYVRV